MTYRDSWDGLRAPTRGTALQPRFLPHVVRSRDLTVTERRRQVGSGELTPLRPGVLLPVGEDRTRRVRLVLAHARAVEIHSRGPVVLTGQVAALLLGCSVLWPRLPVHVLRERQSQVPATLRDVVVKHRGTVPLDQVRLHGTSLVTSLELTAVFCARTLPFVEALAIMDSAVRLGADLTLIDAMLADMDGARGVRAARRVRAETAPCHSPGESVVRGCSRDHGLVQPRTLYQVMTELGVVELDLAWPAQRVAVEFDGAAKLAGLTGEALTRQVNRNAAREAALVKDGWVVLHLTWSDLHDLPALGRRLVRLVTHRRAD